MKAIIYTQYGSADVLRLQDVAKPTPKDNEVLVKVHATSINAADKLFLNGSSFMVRLMAGGNRKPKNPILGADVAGIVEAVGSSVTQFKVGDAVFGDLSEAGRATFAEYVVAPEASFVLKPTNITFEQAAAVPLAAITALQGLRDKGQVQAGQKVLVNGASGGVGSFVVQLAKFYGAEVTATTSTSKLDVAKALGADHVIDYSKHDITRLGKQYDLIMDVGAYRSVFDYKPILTPKGRYVLMGGSIGQIMKSLITGPLASFNSSKTLTTLSAKVTQPDLRILAELLATGKITPMIDRCYPLSEATDAMRYFETGKVKGKVVISVNSTQ